MHPPHTHMHTRRNGVVTAEEMAPYLDPPAPKEGAGTEPAYDEESFVLPALIKFGGEAVVDEDGHLLYSFPSLQRSGVLVSVRCCSCCLACARA